MEKPKSALSGNDLEPGADVPLQITFPDKAVREIRVSQKEADNLRDEGKDLSPWYVHLARRAAKPSKWVLVLFITSLVVPAVTKQWADRPKELELKNSMATTLGSSAASTILSSGLIVAGDIPEIVARRHACTRDTGQASDAKKCAKAMETGLNAEVTLYNATLAEWRKQGAIVEANAEAYFAPEPVLRQDIEDYVGAVTDYLRLASHVCDGDRNTTTDKVLAYLHLKRASSFSLYDLSGNQCVDKWTSPGYLGQYRSLAGWLLKQRVDLLAGVVDANAEGFSTDRWDFFHDVGGWATVFILLVLLLVALLYEVVILGS